MFSYLFDFLATLLISYTCFLLYNRYRRQRATHQLEGEDDETQRDTPLLTYAPIGATSVKRLTPPPARALPSPLHLAAPFVPEPHAQLSWLHLNPRLQQLLRALAEELTQLPTLELADFARTAPRLASGTFKGHPFTFSVWSEPTTHDSLYLSLQFIHPELARDWWICGPRDTNTPGLPLLSPHSSRLGQSLAQGGRDLPLPLIEPPLLHALHQLLNSEPLRVAIEQGEASICWRIFAPPFPPLSDLFSLLIAMADLPHATDAQILSALHTLPPPYFPLLLEMAQRHSLALVERVIEMLHQNNQHDVLLLAYQREPGLFSAELYRDTLINVLRWGERREQAYAQLLARGEPLEHLIAPLREGLATGAPQSALFNAERLLTDAALHDEITLEVLLFITRLLGNFSLEGSERRRTEALCEAAQHDLARWETLLCTHPDIYLEEIIFSANVDLTTRSFGASLVTRILEQRPDLLELSVHAFPQLPNEIALNLVTPISQALYNAPDQDAARITTLLAQRPTLGTTRAFYTLAHDTLQRSLTPGANADQPWQVALWERLLHDPEESEHHFESLEVVANLAKVHPVPPMRAAFERLIHESTERGTPTLRARALFLIGTLEVLPQFCALLSHTTLSNAAMSEALGYLDKLPPLDTLPELFYEALPRFDPYARIHILYSACLKDHSLSERLVLALLPTRTSTRTLTLNQNTQMWYHINAYLMHRHTHTESLHLAMLSRAPSEMLPSLLEHLARIGTRHTLTALSHMIEFELLSERHLNLVHQTAEAIRDRLGKDRLGGLSLAADQGGELSMHTEHQEGSLTMLPSPATPAPPSAPSE